MGEKTRNSDLSYMKHRPKHIIEYVLLRGLLGLTNRLPLRGALAVGWLVAVLLFHGLRFRRAGALARLEEVFGDRYTLRERKRIAWLSLRNICFDAMESARFHKLTLKQIRKMPFYSAIEEANRNYVANGPLIVATVHMGNWDLAGVASKQAGMPIFSIARRQKNPLTDALLNRMRSATGMEVVLNDARVLKNVVRKLKSGGVLAILPDVRQKESDLQVDFLNGKASLGAGTALFAQMAQCPIIPVVFFRRGWVQHDCIPFEPIHPDPSRDKKEDRERIMQELITVFDQEIMNRPEQYFWFNKRWVLDPKPGSRPAIDPGINSRVKPVERNQVFPEHVNPGLIDG
jgi:KDO2-lipid IV(A) lauroyltransferase